MDNFDEPVGDYATHFRDIHAAHVSEFFEELVAFSGVDETLNAKTVAEFRDLEGKVSTSGTKRALWRILRVALVISVGVFGYVSYLDGWNPFLIAAGVLFVVLLFWKVNPAVKVLNSGISELEEARDAKGAEAWAQMDPLNRLYQWDTAKELFHKTFPAINFDAYVTAHRLIDLEQTYGLSPEIMNYRSVHFPLGGTLDQNPFVIARYAQHWIGSRTYEGSIKIAWVEYVRDSQGNTVPMQREQVLTARVEKPFPEFDGRGTVYYGHEAAPQLSFSRFPSHLSGLKDGAISGWRKDRAVKKVERLANRQLKSGSGQLTVMSNREFDALFNAVNRDHEIEFRLLFTPLAQQEMVKILNDKQHGYGDDFGFIKEGPINAIESQHLVDCRLDASPDMFFSFDLRAAREFFNSFHNEYFRAVYFALAPLRSVPLYRDKRSALLPTTGVSSTAISSWEFESMANLVGEGYFKHPESVTYNILKTRIVGGTDEARRVAVLAYGYKAVPRVDYVPMNGGDGNRHQVPVHWTEYIPVERESHILVGVIPGATSVPFVGSSGGYRTVDDVAREAGFGGAKIFVRGDLFVAA